jgi:TRAP-type C4-dicarboxylate transport system substrate-binding protein
MKSTTTTILLAGLAALCTTTGAWAQKAWKLASAAQPGSVLVTFVDEMVSKSNAGSGGELKMERLFVASEQEIVQQLARGRMEMGTVSYTGIAGLMPEAAVLTVPYLWVSAGERDYVTGKYALPALQKIAETKGLVIIGLGEVGWTDVFCKKACLTPDTVKGMKVRVAPAPTSRMFWSALATNGVQLPLSELFPALQSGMVEGADLPFPYYVTTPAAQSAPHYVLTQHLHQGALVLVNKKVWDAQTPALRKVITEAAPDIARMRKEVDAELKPKMADFKSKGGFVHELTPAQRAEWRKLVEPHQAKLVQDLGGASGEVWDAVQKGKKEYAASGGK